MTAKPFWIAMATVLVAALTACTERSDQAAPRPAPTQPANDSEATLVAADYASHTAFTTGGAEPRDIGGSERLLGRNSPWGG